MKNTRQRVITTQGTPEYSYVRFLNAVPISPVDIYSNDILIKQNLRYGIPSEYYEYKPGKITVQGRVIETGEMKGLATFILPENSVVTIAGIGVNSDKAKILQIPDAYPVNKSDTMSYLRFINLSSDVPPVDVKLNNTTIFQNIEYREITEYHKFNPGDYTLGFDSSASGIPLFNNLNVSLQPGNVYTVYTIGNNEDGERKAALITDSNITTHIDY
jgi:hypothetical protein